MKRVLLQSAHVLHRRAYREKSFLVELITPEYGRLPVIARGVRQSQSSAQGLLQPFVPLLISWAGKGDLPVLSHIEADGMARHLQGECLFAGFYLNELLINLLQKWDPHPGLYAAYETAVQRLQAGVLEQKILRSFEKYLLEALGYGLLSKSDVSLLNTFSPDQFYRFVPEQGLVLCEPLQIDGSRGNIFSGKNLIAIAREDWQDEACLKDARRLMRLVLGSLPGMRHVHSRRLFMPS